VGQTFALRIDMLSIQEARKLAYGTPYHGNQLRRIACVSEVCERTVARWLRGEAIRPSSAERIQRAISKLGETIAPTNNGKAP
jgi:hypothetical protein